MTSGSLSSSSEIIWSEPLEQHLAHAKYREWVNQKCVSKQAVAFGKHVAGVGKVQSF